MIQRLTSFSEAFEFRVNTIIFENNNIVSMFPLFLIQNGDLTQDYDYTGFTGCEGPLYVIVDQNNFSVTSIPSRYHITHHNSASYLGRFVYKWSWSNCSSLRSLRSSSSSSSSGGTDDVVTISINFTSNIIKFDAPFPVLRFCFYNETSMELKNLPQDELDNIYETPSTQICHVHNNKISILGPDDSTTGDFTDQTYRITVFYFATLNSSSSIVEITNNTLSIQDKKSYASLARNNYHADYDFFLIDSRAKSFLIENNLMSCSMKATAMLTIVYVWFSDVFHLLVRENILRIENGPVLPLGSRDFFDVFLVFMSGVVFPAETVIFKNRLEIVAPMRVARLITAMFRLEAKLHTQSFPLHLNSEDYYLNNKKMEFIENVITSSSTTSTSTTVITLMEKGLSERSSAYFELFTIVTIFKDYSFSMFRVEKNIIEKLVVISLRNFNIFDSQCLLNIRLGMIQGNFSFVDNLIVDGNMMENIHVETPGSFLSQFFFLQSRKSETLYLRTTTTSSSSSTSTVSIRNNIVRNFKVQMTAQNFATLQICMLFVYNLTGVSSSSSFPSIELFNNTIDTDVEAPGIFPAVFLFVGYHTISNIFKFNITQNSLVVSATSQAAGFLGFCSFLRKLVDVEHVLLQQNTLFVKKLAWSKPVDASVEANYALFAAAEDDQDSQFQDRVCVFLILPSVESSSSSSSSSLRVVVGNNDITCTFETPPGSLASNPQFSRFDFAVTRSNIVALRSGSSNINIHSLVIEFNKFQTVAVVSAELIGLSAILSLDCDVWIVEDSVMISNNKFHLDWTNVNNNNNNVVVGQSFNFSIININSNLTNINNGFIVDNIDVSASMKLFSPSQQQQQEYPISFSAISVCIKAFSKNEKCLHSSNEAKTQGTSTMHFKNIRLVDFSSSSSSSSSFPENEKLLQHQKEKIFSFLNVFSPSAFSSSTTIQVDNTLGIKTFSLTPTAILSSRNNYNSKTHVAIIEKLINEKKSLRFSKWIVPCGESSSNSNSFNPTTIHEILNSETEIDVENSQLCPPTQQTLTLTQTHQLTETVEPLCASFGIFPLFDLSSRTSARVASMSSPLEFVFQIQRLFSENNNEEKNTNTNNEDDEKENEMMKFTKFASIISPKSIRMIFVDPNDISSSSSVSSNDNNKRIEILTVTSSEGTRTIRISFRIIPRISGTETIALNVSFFQDCLICSLFSPSSSLSNNNNNNNNNNNITWISLQKTIIFKGDSDSTLFGSTGGRIIRGLSSFSASTSALLMRSPTAALAQQRSFFIRSMCLVDTTAPPSFFDSPLGLRVGEPRLEVPRGTCCGNLLLMVIVVFLCFIASIYDGYQRKVVNHERKEKGKENNNKVNNRSRSNDNASNNDNDNNNNDNTSDGDEDSGSSSSSEDEEETEEQNHFEQLLIKVIFSGEFLSVKSQAFGGFPNFLFLLLIPTIQGTVTASFTLILDSSSFSDILLGILVLLLPFSLLVWILYLFFPATYFFDRLVTVTPSKKPKINKLWSSSVVTVMKLVIDYGFPAVTWSSKKDSSSSATTAATTTTTTTAEQNKKKQMKKKPSSRKQQRLLLLEQLKQEQEQKLKSRNINNNNNNNKSSQLVVERIGIAFDGCFEDSFLFILFSDILTGCIFGFLSAASSSSSSFWCSSMRLVTCFIISILFIVSLLFHPMNVKAENFYMIFASSSLLLILIFVIISLSTGNTSGKDDEYLQLADSVSAILDLANFIKLIVDIMICVALPQYIFGRLYYFIVKWYNMRKKLARRKRLALDAGLSIEDAHNHSMNRDTNVDHDDGDDDDDDCFYGPNRYRNPITKKWRMPKSRSTEKDRKKHDKFRSLLPWQRTEYLQKISAATSSPPLEKQQQQQEDEYQHDNNVDDEDYENENEDITHKFIPNYQHQYSNKNDDNINNNNNDDNDDDDDIQERNVAAANPKRRNLTSKSSLNAQDYYVMYHAVQKLEPVRPPHRAVEMERERSQQKQKEDEDDEQELESSSSSSSEEEEEESRSTSYSVLAPSSLSSVYSPSSIAAVSNFTNSKSSKKINKKDKNEIRSSWLGDRKVGDLGKVSVAPTSRFSNNVADAGINAIAFKNQQHQQIPQRQNNSLARRQHKSPIRSRPIQNSNDNTNNNNVQHQQQQQEPGRARKISPLSRQKNDHRFGML